MSCYKKFDFENSDGSCTVSFAFISIHLHIVLSLSALYFVFEELG